MNLDRNLSIAGKQIPLRTVLLVGGTALWFASVVVVTPASGSAAIGQALVFLAGIALLSAPFRTVSLRLIFSAFLLGGSAMAIAGAIELAVHKSMPDNAFSHLCMSIFEQIAMSLPLAYIFWRKRKTLLLDWGATDVLVLAASSGAGFGLVFYAQNKTSFASIPFIKWIANQEFQNIFTRTSYLINGYETWAAIAGGALGVALLFRNKPKVATIAACMVAVPVFDHWLVNATTLQGGPLPLLTLQGHLTAWLFPLSIAACAVADGLVLYRLLPQLSPFFTISRRWWKPAYWPTLQAWRKLAFRSYQCLSAPESKRRQRAYASIGNFLKRVEKRSSAHAAKSIG